MMSAPKSLPEPSSAASLVQNTAHLFGWLYFNSHVGDSDKDQVKADLLALCRTLKGLDECPHGSAAVSCLGEHCEQNT